MSADLQQRIAGAAAALRDAGAREVHLFASAATGTMREGSDVDLAVAGLPPRQYFRAMGRAAEILGRPLSLVDLDEGHPFTRYLKEEGVLQRVG